MSDKALSTGGPDTKPTSSEVQPSCNLCRHWRGLSGSPSGSCRRNPPQVIGSQEYRWPITAADSDCGEFALDSVKQSHMSRVVANSADEDARMRRVAAELLAKAESGELGQAEVEPVIDTMNPAPFTSSLVPKHTGLKPNVPKPHIPVLTVDQARKFAGK